MIGSADLHGPWSYNPRTDQVSTNPADGRPHGAVVASIGHHRDFISKATIGAAVSAVPDLVEALEDALEALAMCQPRTDHGARSQSAAMHKARATLAKAKGELQ